MSHAESTCWTLIEGAARGRPEDRENLAHRYAPLIQATLRARWAGRQLVDVARQVERGRGHRKESALESDAAHDLATAEDTLARQFDRAWAESLLSQAGDLELTGYVIKVVGGGATKQEGADRSPRSRHRR